MRLTVIPIHPYSQDHHAQLSALARRYDLQVNYYELAMGDPSILEKIKGTELLIITPRLPFDILPALEGCRLISLESTGTDMIDLDRARSMGITVTNVPDYSTQDVAERIFALLLSLTHHLPAGHATVTNGTWDSPTSQISIALHGRVMGIYGMGKIGQTVAKIAHAFGMKVIAHTAHPDSERARQLDLKWVEFDDLLVKSDVLVLASPATAENHEKFNADAFARMKKGAFFINTARGALVNEAALAHALTIGHLAGAGVDVFQKEPIQRDNPLLAAPNVILSPHTAFASDRSLSHLHAQAITNVEAFMTSDRRS